MTGVGYSRVTLTWGITRLQKICTEPCETLLISGFCRRQQQHSREWQRQQPLVVSCPRAATISKSIILYVYSCACYSLAAVTHDKKHSSVEATYFYIIVINNSLKNWCAQLTRLWLSPYLVNGLSTTLTTCGKRQRGVGNGLGGG